MPEIGDYIGVNQASFQTCNCQSECACAVAINPNLAASCENGGCQAWDVRQREDFSGCQTDTDCRLRNGLDCCEPCSGDAYQLIAIRNEGEAGLKAALCTGTETCSKCLAQYPPNASAKCVSNHCQVQLTQ
jgi:hypothetical protein